MLAFVFSDSHGKTENMESVLNETMPDIVIHLGDHVEDAQFVSDYFGIDVIGVSGNSLRDIVSDMPEYQIISLKGHNIYLCHGHCHNVKTSYLSLSYAALENNASLALFGHTHVPCDETYNGVRLINPGSISKGWRGNTYAELVITRNEIKCTIKNA